MVIVTSVLGSGGVALAGGLPAPIQEAVANMTRALPIPFHLPYPVLSTDDVLPDVPVVVDRVPEDGEVYIGPHRAGDSGSVPTSDDEPVEPAPDPGSGAPMDARFDEEPHGDRCDPGAIWEARDELSIEQREDLWDSIRKRCPQELVDPPRWTRGFRSDDKDRGWDGSWADGRGEDEWGEDRRDSHDEPDGEHRDDEYDGDDGDLRSSDSGRSDESDANGDDEQEERHDDDEEDDDGDQESSDDEWRDRHD
jgi:hypothetical protein